MADQESILEALRTVKDPELGVNVVDLGLVYTVQTREDQVDVEMTLTSPACPAGPQILRESAAAVERLDGVTNANVRLVMNPPWSQDKMTDAARDSWESSNDDRTNWLCERNVGFREHDRAKSCFVASIVG